MNIRKSCILSFIVIALLAISENAHAQRTVVKTSKNKTVVTTRGRNVVYTKHTPTIRTIRTLPPTAITVKRSGVHYHCHAGLFYRHIDNRYIVVAPPIGLRIATLPVKATRIILTGRTYYYYGGTYYIKVKKEYEVVEAPKDIIVYSLPEEAEEIMIDGKRYFIYDNILYTIVHTPEGKGFKVTGKLED